MWIKTFTYAVSIEYDFERWSYLALVLAVLSYVLIHYCVLSLLRLAQIKMSRREQCLALPDIIVWAVGISTLMIGRLATLRRENLLLLLISFATAWVRSAWYCLTSHSLHLLHSLDSLVSLCWYTLLLGRFGSCSRSLCIAREKHYHFRRGVWVRRVALIRSCQDWVVKVY